jgi:hypothetical protein
MGEEVAGKKRAKDLVAHLSKSKHTISKSNFEH